MLVVNNLTLEGGPGREVKRRREGGKNSVFGQGGR